MRAALPSRDVLRDLLITSCPPILPRPSVHGYPPRVPDLRSSAAWYRAKADEAESLIASLRELGEAPEGLIEALQDRIRRLKEAAERLEALTAGQSRDNDMAMNLSVQDRQKRRRGHAVAAGKAKGKVAAAIVASQWKTQTAYAKRLRISQPALSQYMTGAAECPAEVDRAVRRDFPALANEPVEALWKKGVRE